MKFSISTLRRLPVYLDFLKMQSENCENISATAIASALKLGEVQVRKDLGSVSGAGRPKVGYNRKKLIETLENYLGYNNAKKAVIVGAGKLGEALMGYGGFRDYGLDIVAAFDVKNIGNAYSNKPVYHINALSAFCKKENIELGIITVPASSAQVVADLMYESGIRALWNFAPVHLDVSDDVLVHNENMAASLALLKKQLEGTEFITD